MPDRRLTLLQRKARAEAIALLGNKCARCGFTDYRALQIDHVQGKTGYWNNRKSIITYYKGVIESAKRCEGKYQVLCANCNWIKKAENNER